MQQLTAGMQETAATVEEVNVASMTIEDSVRTIPDKAVEGLKSTNEIKVRTNGLKEEALTAQDYINKIYSRNKESIDTLRNLVSRFKV